MNKVKIRKKRRKALLIFALSVLVLFGGSYAYRHSRIRKDIEKRRAASVKEAILNAAFQCYAVEGIYPENLKYLQDYYGLMVNTKLYFISYDCCASNEPPEVMVLKR